MNVDRVPTATCNWRPDAEVRGARCEVRARRRRDHTSRAPKRYSRSFQKCAMATTTAPSASPAPSSTSFSRVHHHNGSSQNITPHMPKGTAALAAAHDPIAPRVDGAPTQEAAGPPGGAILHTRPQRAFARLQPALISSVGLPHAAQVSAQGRQAPHPLQCRPHLLDPERTPTRHLARRCCRNTSAHRLTSSSTSERGPPPARPHTLR
jgi:hypothetical protein